MVPSLFRLAFPVCSGTAAGFTYRHPSVILKEIIPIAVAFGREPAGQRKERVRGKDEEFVVFVVYFLKTGSASGLRSNRVHLTNPPQIS